MRSTDLPIWLSMNFGAIRLPSLRALARPGRISKTSFLIPAIARFASISTLIGFAETAAQLRALIAGLITIVLAGLEESDVIEKRGKKRTARKKVVQ